ncbi:MAG: GNAT family N-acetyltransferase [Betaproteobacteria bacterium]|nr:GNAT family N-acetyltransferase [Betaproteobacteria bacterium]
MGGRVRISAVEARDTEAIAALANYVWRRHYPGIITPAQIDYMLTQRYNPDSLREQLGLPGNWWDKLTVRGELVAFSNYFLTGSPGEMKLDKLYVHQEHQRTGYGGMLIERARQVAREQGCTRLILAVNKNNTKAVASYKKHGFAVVDSVVKDIGGGFVMDDYIMAIDI